MYTRVEPQTLLLMQFSYENIVSLSLILSITFNLILGRIKCSSDAHWNWFPGKVATNVSEFWECLDHGLIPKLYWW